MNYIGSKKKQKILERENQFFRDRKAKLKPKYKRISEILNKMEMQWLSAAL